MMFSFFNQFKLQKNTQNQRIIIFLFLFLLIQHVFVGESQSQTEKSEIKQETLQHEVQVTLKLVQVYVTDKKGNPVTDLEKEDFDLYENGERKIITEFEKHVLSMPPSKAEHEKKAHIIKKMNRKFFLFFDFAFNNPRGIIKSKESALHFIDTQLQPNDEVGVLSYSTLKSLTLHEYLTRDHKKVREVVEGFGLKDVLGRAEDVEEQYWKAKGEISSLRADEEPPPVAGTKHSWLQQFWGLRLKNLEADRLVYRTQVSNFSLKIKELAKALRYIPGRKNIILFSCGPAYSVVYDYSPGFFVRDAYIKMFKELAASNSSVFAVNTDELDSIIHKEDSWTGIYPLQRLARVTGGKYFNFNLDYKEVIEEINNSTHSYYVLGYYIDEKWDGKYNKIEVKIKKKGYKVHSQEGYFNPKPFAKYSDLEKRLHLIDLALTENPQFQTPLNFPSITLPCSVRGKSGLVIMSKIPVEKIQEISGQEVEIVSIAFDKENNIVKLKRDEADFSRLPKENIYYSSLLSLPSGEFKCRIVIRNLDTGRGAVSSSSVTIPESLKSGIKLYPPLLLKVEKDAFYLKGPPAVYPFDKTQYSPLIEELKRGISRLLAVVRCSVSDIRQPDIKLSANLICQSTSQDIPLTISVLKKYQENDTEIFFIELQTEELQSGKYFLYLFGDEMNTKSNSYVSTTFNVK